MEGTVQEIDGTYVLRFERRLGHPIEKAWKMLAEPDLLAEWLAEADLELLEGGQVGLRWQGRHGYYRAEKSEAGDHEIRSVPTSEGEHSMLGGDLPKEGFGEHYKRMHP